MLPAQLRPVALLAILVLGSTPGLAAEYHVGPGGAGTGTGTAADPFDTIAQGLDAAQPGDTVIVAAGTYSESLQTVRDGIEGAPIVLRGDTTDGPVVVTASGRVLRVDHAHFTIEDLVFDGQYGDSDALDINDGANHLTLRRCEVRYSGRDCVDMGAPQDVLFVGCLIHHCLNSEGGRTDAHGITGGAVQRLTIRDTEIHSFSGDGVQFDPGRELPGWSDVLIEGCHIWLAPLLEPANGFAAGTVPGENAVDTKTHNDAPRATLVIRDSTFSGFRNGLISNMAALNLKENIDALLDRITLRDNEIALRLRGPTSDRPAGSWVRAQNVVIYDADVAVRYEDDLENLRLWHVTMGGDVAAPFVEAAADNAQLDVRNLLILAATLPAEVQAPGNSGLAVGETAFVDAAGHDYHLAAGSPAIDHGNFIAEMFLDRDAVSRPQGAAPDVGAYEWCDDCVPQTQLDAGTSSSPDAAPGTDPDAGTDAGTDPGTPDTGCGCQHQHASDAPASALLILLGLGLWLWLGLRLRLRLWLRLRLILILSLSLSLGVTGAGCGDDGGGPGGDAAVTDANADGDGSVESDGGQLQNCDQGPPATLGRGLTWVRDNPMFITGLTVAVSAPSADRVDEYFDDFAANAVHLWEDGLPTQMDGWAAAGRSDFRFLSWVRGDGTSHDGGLLLGGYGANPVGRIGYQISDEPRSMADLTALEVGIDAVRAVDPEALIVVNFSLSADGLPQMLDYYADHMDGDVIAFDTYVYSNAVYERYGQFREAGLTSGRPYWCYLNAYVDAGETTRPTESDMRWNALLALTYGYTGVTWFIYQIGPPHSQDLDPILFVSAGDLTTAKTEHFGYAAQLNRELAQLGRVITQLTSTDVRYISSLANVHPLGVQAWTPGAGCDPWLTGLWGATGEPEDLLLGFFVDDAGERYLMIQNAHHAQGVFPVNSTDPITLQVAFDFSDQTDPDFATDAVLHLDKLTGQVVPAPLTDLGQGRAELTLTIAAGDTYLFKYDTGRPFALQPAP